MTVLESQETAAMAVSRPPAELSDMKTTTVPVVSKIISEKELPTWRKYLILFVVSWMTLVVTFSSTSLLSATPEIAADLATTSEIVDVTNSGMLVAMGFSPLIWSPLSDVLGRRRIYNMAIFFNFAFSIGVALANRLGMFVAFRLLGGFTGCYFMVAGQTIIADIFEPVRRGRATGFFMVGSVAGPALGPCIAGIIVTFNNWRTIFWLQTAMSGLGLVLSVLVIPAIESTSAFRDDKTRRLCSRLLSRLNPTKVFKQFAKPKVILADLACGFLAVSNYGLLACIRAVINPRFHLTTPLISGLFYIAPGIGFILGSIIGGRMSDRTVKKYIAKRNGTRLPEDRLNSGTVSLLFILPASMLILGWCLDQGVGGLALPIVAAFWAGVGLLGAFNSLNTFVAEISPTVKAEVISTKYIIQYALGAMSTAAIVPLIDAIGIGWAFTCLVILDLFAWVLIFIITKVLTPKV